MARCKGYHIACLLFLMRLEEFDRDSVQRRGDRQASGCSALGKRKDRLKSEDRS
jgi:hypothetical protein